MVPRLHLANALADPLDDPRTLVSEHGGQRHRVPLVPDDHVRVTYPRGDDTHQHLIRPGLLELEILDGEGLRFFVYYRGGYLQVTTPPEISLTPWRSILPFYLPKKATTGEGVFGFSERMAQHQVLLIGLETQVYEGGLVRREPGCAHLEPEPRGTRRHLGDELPFFSRTGA